MTIGDSSRLTSAAALAALHEAGGRGPVAATAWAPGRCTLVGEHVDYAGGFVLCIGVDLGIAVAVRRSDAARYLVASRGSVVIRTSAEPLGDMADRVLAPVVALRSRGIDVPPVEVGVAATLPAGAGLASSAALMVAMTTAILRLTGSAMTPRELAAVALSAERDVLGIPCGPLDQRAIVDAPDGGALLLDCRTGAESEVPWPWPDAVIVGCDTGTHHDVGAAEYRRRRDETEQGLAALHVDSCQELTEAAIDGAELPPNVTRRLRHVLGESVRAVEAAGTLRGADLSALGSLMSASHRSLRELHEVSTPTLDAVAGAARTVPGCAGARLVGAGFGGTVVALVDRSATDACRQAMAGACGGGETFEIRPSAGVALLAPDVVRG
ncbi:MAG: galactokinase family protein [Candidatus Dormiibacterota bacterium]